MIGYDFIEASFDSKKTDTCKLSILAGMDSFAFMVHSAAGELQLAKKVSLDNPTGDPMVFGRLFNQLMSNHAWLSLPWERVVLAWFSPLFTLVPNNLLVSEDKSLYFRNLTKEVGTDDLLFEHKLSRLAATGVFALNKGLHFLLSLPFPQARILPFSAAYLDALLSLPLAGRSLRLFVHLHHKYLVLTLLEGSQLRLHNYYMLSGENDLLHYCLLAMKQFDMRPDTDPVYVSGYSGGDHSGFRLLTAYLSHLQPIEYPFSTTFGPQGSRIPLSQLFDLLCVSHHT